MIIFTHKLLPFENLPSKLGTILFPYFLVGPYRGKGYGGDKTNPVYSIDLIVSSKLSAYSLTSHDFSWLQNGQVNN